MPNLISGLKYQPTIQKAETEEQLLEVFSDLREQYSKFDQNFRIFTPTGEPVKDFKHFIRLAVQENQSVVLTGRENIGRLDVKNASLEYDLSRVGDLTRYWDLKRGGSCYSCHNHYYADSSGDAKHACGVMDSMDWSGKCPEYMPYINNFEGKAARVLDELISESVML